MALSQPYLLSGNGASSGFENIYGSWNDLESAWKATYHFTFVDSVSFAQFPLDLCLPDVMNCQQLGGVNLGFRRFIFPTDSGDQGQLGTFPKYDGPQMFASPVVKPQDFCFFTVRSDGICCFSGF